MSTRELDARVIFESQVIFNDLKLKEEYYDPSELSRRPLNKYSILIDALVSYLLQFCSFQEKTLRKVFSENPNTVDVLLNYFSVKFDPDLFKEKNSDRKDELQIQENEFFHFLADIYDVSSDTILRTAFELFKSIMRTNFFFENRELDSPLVFKINMSRMASCDRFKNAVETFVFSPDFEGIHVRLGQTRGGADIFIADNVNYRKEVYEKLSAELATRISEIGSQACFVINSQVRKDREKDREVEEVFYKNFVESLFSLSDRVDANWDVRIPERCLTYNFSNTILSQNLGENFDKVKTLASTSAIDDLIYSFSETFRIDNNNWYHRNDIPIAIACTSFVIESHLIESGFDLSKQQASLVYIGTFPKNIQESSVLCNNNINIVAAFDDKNIFIDPCPNFELAIKERNRLASLQYPEWANYNREVISSGGDVFLRDQNLIQVSDQIKNLLSLEHNFISGSELIKSILRGPFDILWSAGRGIYIKSSEENNFVVTNIHNRNIRVNARDLKFKVVGELNQKGFTKAARVEFSLGLDRKSTQGRINSEFIDCGGVSALIDREDRLQILLFQLIRKGLISKVEKQEIFDKSKVDLRESVFKRIKAKFLNLSHLVYESEKNVLSLVSLLEILENLKIIDRAQLSLPNISELERRSIIGKGLTRPELAIITNRVKNYLYKKIISSDIPENPYFRGFLLAYFPPFVRKNFHEEIFQHPNRREILSLELANRMIHLLGPVFPIRNLAEDGFSIRESVQSFAIVYALIKPGLFYNSLEDLFSPEHTRDYIKLTAEFNFCMSELAMWFLLFENLEDPMKIEIKYSNEIKEKYSLLFPVDSSLSGAQKNFEFLIENSLKKVDFFKNLPCILDCTQIFKNDNIEQIPECNFSYIENIYNKLYNSKNFHFLSQWSMFDKDRWTMDACRLMHRQIRKDIRNQLLEAFRTFSKDCVRH